MYIPCKFMPGSVGPARVGAVVTLWLLAMGATATEPVPDLPGGLAGDAIPQVLTPARLQQAQVDVAASVTVLDRQMISALGARDIPELLRLVPGMMVVRVSGHDFSANYHGTNLRDIRRLQVLVDGMSVYQPGLARILWSDLALSIDDIERIEVTRGPNAAAYGANSFSGVVNIITTHPQDSADHMLRVTAGNRETIDSGGRLVGHSPDSDYRLSFSTRADGGYDRDRFDAYRDDRAARTLNWRSEYRLTDADRFEVFAGIADTDKQEEAETYGGIFNRYEDEPDIGVQNMHVMGRWSRELSPEHVVQVQAYAQETDIRYRWRSCLDNPVLLSSELAALSAISQDYAFGLLDAAGSADGNGDGLPDDIPTFIGSLPAAAQPVAWGVVATYGGLLTAGYNETCGDVNLDFRESRIDLEVQDTLRVNEDFRLVSGFSYRRDSGSSESYLGGPRHNEIGRLFAHAEYRLATPLLLNVGAMLESDDISGTQLSPRVGLNWRVRDQQALRLVGSRAYRNQDIYEEYANTRITFRNLSPAWPLDGSTTRDLFLVQQSPGNLRPEEITSWELGYFGYFPAARTEMDVRLFREELHDLISDPINFFDFQVDNDAWVDLQGMEWQVRYSFAPGSWLWGSYAYIDNDNFSPRYIEGKFTALHSGSVAVAHRFGSGWTTSAAWLVNRYQNPKFAAGQIVGWFHAERLDLRLAKAIPLGGSTLEVSVNAQCSFDDYPEIFLDNNYDDRVYGYAGVQLTF